MPGKSGPERSAPSRNRLPGRSRLLARSAWKPLPRAFFNASPEQVAPALLGKILAHDAGGSLLAGRIVEVEAYLGEGDPAAHSSIGPTARNAVLFGPPGRAYVYHIYGMHQCMNVSCLPAGLAGCVLLRALEPLEGLDEMRRNRGLGPKVAFRNLTSGPGRICQALAISRAADNGRDLTSAGSPLALYGDGIVCGEISITSRVGVHKAAERPLRFFLAGHACVSCRGR